MLFILSEAVDTLSFKKALSVEPSISFELETKEALSDRIIVLFKDVPQYNSRYLLRINTGVKDALGNESLSLYNYRIVVNGEKSKPPELKAISIEAGAFYETYTVGENFMDLLPGDRTDAKLTLFFDTAQGADVSLYSLMELFSFSATNNVLSFITKTIFHDGRSPEGYERVVITGDLDDDLVESGIITIAVGAGLVDTFGNKQNETKRVVCLK
jgi:uncharacterized alpha/beta hydrolase family protein